MKQIKKTNRGWSLLSILPLAGLLVVGMGFAVSAFAGPGIQISPKEFRPHFNVPSARPAIPCSNLVFQGVRMTGTDFFDPGRNPNHYSIHLMTSVLNSGNAAYNPKPSDRVVVSGRDMGSRSTLSMVPRLNINQRRTLNLTAVIQGHLAPRNPLRVWFSSSTNQCSHRNNTFIVRLRQLRVGFLVARRRAEAAARRVVPVHLYPASSSGTSGGSRVCANLSPVSFSITSKSRVPDAALGTGYRVASYRLRLRGVVENSGDTYRGTFGRVVLKRSSSGSSYTTIRTQLVNNLNHGHRTTIEFMTRPISITEPNMPQYTLSVENTQRGDTACNALHTQHHPDLTISRGTVGAFLQRR